MTRDGSVDPEATAFEILTKMQVLKQTNMLVRMPTGLPRICLSMPMIAPHNIALNKASQLSGAMVIIWSNTEIIPFLILYAAPAVGSF